MQKRVMSTKKIRNRVSKRLKLTEANYWKQKLAEVDKGSSDFGVQSKPYQVAKGQKRNE